MAYFLLETFFIFLYLYRHKKTHSRPFNMGFVGVWEFWEKQVPQNVEEENEIMQDV